MPQKPQTFNPSEFAPVFDPNEFAPVTPKTSELDWFDTAANYIPQPVKSAWNTAWSPLSDLPSRAAKTISEPLMQYGESGTDWTRTPALYGGAFAQSVGDVLSGLTSPGNLALGAATGGVGLASRTAVQKALPVVAPKVAQGLTTAGRAIGGATTAHGAQTIVDPSTTMFEKGLGAIEAVGGGLATRAPRPKAAPISDIPDELLIPSKTAPIESPVLPPEFQPDVPIVQESILGGTSPITPDIPPTPPTMVTPTMRQGLLERGFRDPEINNMPVEEALAYLETPAPPLIEPVARVKPPRGQVFDPTTLKGLEPAAPKPVLEFIDPKTGEIKPASLAKPGDVPLPVRPPEVAAQVPEEVLATVGKDIPPEVTPQQYLEGKPQVDTGPIIPENVRPAADVTASLAQRLKNAVDNAGTPNVVAPEDISQLLDEATQTLNQLPPGSQDAGLIRQILGANKALLTSWDLSAPGRQGKAFIFNKAWWTSLDDMVKAWGSKQAAELVNQSIIDHPSGYFIKPISETGKVGKSFAEKQGLDLTSTEEMFNAKLGQAFEKYSGIGKASRAHTAFLNKLRSDQFVSMMEASKRAGLNPETNLDIAKKYATFINDATGRGSVNIGKWKLERNIGALNDVFFAPKNMAGQIRTWKNVLNPMSYSSADPVMRKQALTSLFAVAGMGLSVGEMARMAGAKVSNDPVSSDFGKIRIGDTRIDPFGGYQQFPVAAMKLILGQSTTTAGRNAGRTTDLTAGRYGQQTRETVAERFFTNRLSPAGSFIYAWMGGREFDGKPFEVKRALYERVFPIAAKDIMELAQEDPAIAALLTPTTIMGLTGAQHYSGRY